MLRDILSQNSYNLSDMKVISEVIDTGAFLRFCTVELARQVYDGEDIKATFVRIFTKNTIQEKLFSQVVEILE